MKIWRTNFVLTVQNSIKFVLYVATKIYEKIHFFLQGVIYKWQAFKIWRRRLWRSSIGYVWQNNVGVTDGNVCKRSLVGNSDTSAHLLLRCPAVSVVFDATDCTQSQLDHTRDSDTFTEPFKRSRDIFVLVFLVFEVPLLLYIIYIITYISTSIRTTHIIIFISEATYLYIPDPYVTEPSQRKTVLCRWRHIIHTSTQRKGSRQPLVFRVGR